LPKAVSSFLILLFIATRFAVLLERASDTKSVMFRRQKHKTRIEIAPLPIELWLVIFDIVIEEGIIRLDHCDYTTFPHMWAALPSSTSRYQVYDSYWRLRLVCRRFNSMLGTLPYQFFSDSSSLPFPNPTRALYSDLEALSPLNFQRLAVGTPTRGRLVYLDVTCTLSESPDRLSLSEFLETGPVFKNVRRVTLRLVIKVFFQSQGAFWTQLNCAFPSLVTLAVVMEGSVAVALKSVGNLVVHFQELEILYLKGEITYSGCHFPRLRHASVWRCRRPELELLTRSPHLESLLIRTYMYSPLIDVTSCLRLKLLGFPDDSAIGLVLLGPDHPVEQIWIYSVGFTGNRDLYSQLAGRLPGISRITVEFLPSYWQHYWRRIDDFREMRLDSFGLTIRPLNMRPSGFPILVIDRMETGGIMRKIWRKMHR
jgi:hypothetical protein